MQEIQVVTRRLTAYLKRCRDNRYGSLFLAALARPLHFVCDRLATQIRRKVRKNGAAIQLPNGRIMRIAKDSGIWMASALFWRGVDGHEPETSRTLRFLFERSATFIDVGANYGLYSIIGALWNPNLRVVAFEPVPPIHEGLRRNVVLNRLEDRITCEILALSGKSGKTTLFLPDPDEKDVATTGTLVADSWQARNNSPRFEVEALQFDDYENRRPMRVDLIKIDVEDFEADVLAGMQGVIRRDRPFIVCEVLPRAHRNERTRNIVESLQYQPYWITPSGYIRVSSFDFARVDCQNFVLSPVSTSEVVLQNLGALWDLRCARPAA
jgi:FkbM family methyltransferase